MPPAPASSTWRSIRSLSAAVKGRRRGRSASSGEAAGGAETTVGLRPPSVSAPPARVFSKWITGMTMGCFDLLPSRVNSRDGLSHHHWHRGGAKSVWARTERSEGRTPLGGGEARGESVEDR